MNDYKNDLVKSIKRFQEGEKEAFDNIYALTNKYVYYSVVKSVKDSDIAADIMQETYCDVYKSLISLKEPEAFKKWIGVIAQHNITHYFMKNPNLYNDEMDEEELLNIAEDNEEMLPEDAMENRELQEIINKVLDELPLKYRKTIVSFYYNQMSIKEIAESMQIPENTVKTYLSRGKAKIKESILQVEKKQGIKLHTVGIGTVLFFMFGEEAAACEIPSQCNTILSAVKMLGEKQTLSMASSFVTGGATTGGIAGKIVASKTISIVIKSLIGLIVAGGLGTGIYFGYQHLTASANNKQNETVVDEDKIEESIEENIEQETVLPEWQVEKEKMKEDAVYEEAYINACLDLPELEEMEQIALAYSNVLKTDPDINIAEKFALYDITGDNIPELFDDMGTIAFTYQNGETYYIYYTWVINEFRFDLDTKQFVVHYKWNEDETWEYYDFVMSDETSDKWLVLDKYVETDMSKNYEVIEAVYEVNEKTQSNMLEDLKDYYKNRYGYDPTNETETIVYEFNIKCPDCGGNISCHTATVNTEDELSVKQNYIDELNEDRLCVHYYCDSCQMPGYRKFIFDNEAYEWSDYTKPELGIKINNGDVKANFYTESER